MSLGSRNDVQAQYSDQPGDVGSRGCDLLSIIFGTREFVVYNPTDQHLMLSHTSWFMLLTPDELEEHQGWYAVNDATSLHWKYFWFD